MQIIRFLLGFSIICAGVLTAYSFYDSYKNALAYELQNRLNEEVNAKIQIQNQIFLGTAGEYDWDYVCPMSYEYTGIDVSDGLKVRHNSFFKGHNISDFQIANDLYNELSPNSRYGLVFINLSEKVIVAISLNDISDIKLSPCVKGENALLNVEMDQLKKKLVLKIF